MPFQFIDNQPIRFKSSKFDDQSCINKDLSAYNILMKPGDPIHWQAKLICCGTDSACNTASEGAELVTDGDMSNAAAFTLGTGWAIAAGVATLTAIGATNGGLLQTGLATATGSQYKILITVNSNDTGFGVDIYLGGRRVGQIEAGLTGIFTFYGTSGSTGSVEVKSSNDYSNASSGTLVVDNLSVKEIATCYTFDTSVIEYVVNGDFTDSSIPWTLGSGWTWINAVNDYVEHTTPALNSSLTQVLTGIANRSDILFTVTIVRIAGSLLYVYGNTIMNTYSLSGVYSFNYPAFGLDQNEIEFIPSSNFDGDVDTVSATETQSGWSYSPENGFCHITGWANSFYAGATLTVGRYYKMTIEVVMSGGSLLVEAGGLILGTITETGVYDYYFTALTTAGERFTPSIDFDGCILDTISLCFLFRTVLQARLVYEDGVTGATDWHTTSSSSNPLILDGEWVTWRINSLAAILSGGVPVALPYSCFRMQVRAECDPADPVSISTSTSDTVINYAATHGCTKLFMAYCDGDALDFRFGDDGNMFRLYSRLRTLYFNPSYPVDAEDYEFSSGLQQRVFATRKKKYELLFDYCDEYAHDVIGLMIVCDTMIIDNVQYIADGKDYAPEWAERGKRNLAQSIIELQKSDGVLFNRNCS